MQVHFAPPLVMIALPPPHSINAFHALPCTAVMLFLAVSRRLATPAMSGYSSSTVSLLRSMKHMYRYLCTMALANMSVPFADTHLYAAVPCWCVPLWKKKPHRFTCNIMLVLFHPSTHSTMRVAAHEKKAIIAWARHSMKHLVKVRMIATPTHPRPLSWRSR